MLNILYIFCDLEYKNEDHHIVGLIVSPHIPIVSKEFKIQIKKLGVKSQYVSILVFTATGLERKTT